MLELKHKLDPTKGKYFCLRCMRYYDEVVPKINTSGVEWLTCPLCHSPKVFTSTDQKPVNELDF